MSDIVNKVAGWFSEITESCSAWLGAHKKWAAAMVVLAVVGFGVGSYVALPSILGIFASQKEFLGALFASQSGSSLASATSSNNNATLAEASAAKDCPFETSAAPSHEGVILNEIAWMGNKESPNNEWIELKNSSSDAVDISGWTIVNKNEKIKVIFNSGTKVPAGAFFLLERGGADFLPGVKADDFFTGSLKNNGDSLRLFDSDCNLVDQVLTTLSWPAGDNKTKKTMERNDATLAWHTSTISGGTPKKENSAYIQLLPKVAPAPLSQPVVAQPTIATHLLISEIAPTFVEFYNPDSYAIDLTGWTIKKRTSTGSESVFIAASRLKNKIVQPGQYFLAVNSVGYAGSVLPNVTWPSSYTLSSSNNAVAVYNNLGKKVEEVGWTLIPKGQSYERDSWSGSAFHLQSNPNPQNSP